MSPIPKWLGDSHWETEKNKLHPPLRLENFSMDPGKLLQPDAYGISATGSEKVCMLKLSSYLDKPLMEIIRQKRTAQYSQSTSMQHTIFHNALSLAVLIFSIR